MLIRMKTHEVLSAGAVALPAAIEAEAKNRSSIDALLAEARYYRTHLPEAPKTELRCALEFLLRRVEEARVNHRRQNRAIFRLRDILRRARHGQDPRQSDIYVAQDLHEHLSPLVDRTGLPDCRRSEDHLRRAVRAGAIDRDGIVGHLKALCEAPHRGF